MAYVVPVYCFSKSFLADNKMRPAILFLIGYFTCSFFVQAKMDFQSWDSLSGWFQTAKDIIISCASQSPEVACIFPQQEGDANFKAFVNRHPQFLYWHYAIFSYAENDYLGSIILLLAIDIFILIIFTLGIDVLRKSNLSSTQIFFVTYAAASYPLLENHHFLVGYAEMIMLAAGLLLMMIVRFFRSHRRWWAAATGIAVGGIFCSLKNISVPIIVAMTAVAMCILTLQVIIRGRKSTVLYLMVFFFTASLLGIFAYFHLTSLDKVYQVWLGSFRFGIDATGETLIMLLGGYRLGIGSNDFSDVFNAFFNAFLYNQSFSVSWILSALLVYELRSVLLNKAALDLLLPMSTIVGYFFFAGLSPHILDHSSPGSDTYGSRYLMFALSLCLLCWGSLVLEKTKLSHWRSIPKTAATSS
ncbi:hypothetical protein N9A55_07885 [Luminiphilus sp.]|nr:hypothetical protein [Luminiphilus sp.]